MQNDLLYRGRALTTAETLALSSGAVTTPDTYDFPSRIPRSGGLYSEEVFGLADHAALAHALGEDARHERWGHIALHEPMLHPLRAGHVLTHILVVPPCYRRFILRSAEESRQSAWNRRAKILAMNEYSIRTQEKLLEQRGLLHPSDIERVGPTWVQPPLNGHYRAVVDANMRIERLRELRAPADTLRHWQDRLLFRTKGLYDELVGLSMRFGAGLVLRALSVSVDAVTASTSFS
ncbi:hypothetical protein LVJ94_41720 [Pendulispora rubella]|uniref:DNA-directed RNA polymerase n=1 Tax=Pendulispora rubella TaxID=2741070 RepID=A0ABZ2KXK2_9BACT